jgi:3-hydroxyisobutyrate dehydrogenase
MIGLGAMGLGMANNIAEAGLLSTVYNRTENKAKTFASNQGIAVSSSPQQLAEQVDIVLICVSADEDVLQMVTAVSETIKPDSIVIDLSTVSSTTAKKAAVLLAERHVFFLDAPVSGGVEGAKNGTLATMVGGDENAFIKAYPVLEAMSSRIIHMGETGAGQNTKAVNQIMAAGINQAVSEALAFGNAQGLSLEKVIEIVSAGAAGNWFLQHRGATMINGVFEPGFKLALHHKDLKICQKLAQQKQLSSYMIDRTLTDYEILMERGFGDEDISALYRLKNRIEK